ncbi:putative polysaccharide biosynthesis protein [Apilactobacillus timberlakei]|uniref:Polysaccharide biosynthesis protein n=1 Tax=Apilactobacillus timberlakei TaxID=2008380 RepID=A0ABY2YUE8_9LACO|nr:polysaccharide biosynthesis protein [Apilactobacillus timberlakei]TPR14078.1 polysaccharide biosynthesis protein [Apilactobacillus timberlakei]TPR15394.1 polysaccharide biosynthesis protein [Apilactobacillus timberlakei]TPR17285.1 polysaccharide biosynthesis protein [Apilactobacillus timberlakei]
MQEQNENNINSDQQTQNKMLQGSAWMTAGSILSRILGAIYIIPWSIWFGAFYLQANALYVQGYNIYSMFLIISIAGIPSAIAKEVAHYNALNEYGISLRLYKRGLVLSFTTGIICALALYFGAPLLDNGNTNVIPVIHSLSWAVLIIPTMSLTRGYFQGFQDMAPSAISQFAEQLFRVIYMLVTAFFIMRVIHGNWTTAVTQSTFAAFIGSLAGLIILGIYYLKRRKYYSHLIENSNNEIHVNANHLYKEIISQAIPFIILGAGITIFQLIDQYTFFDVMKISTNYPMNVLNKLYAIFAGNANKLIMITISLASAMAITVVPLLSEAFTKNDKKGISHQLSNGFILFSFVMIPAALGMTAVSGPLNRVFYGTGYNHLSANILAFSSIVSILFGLFTVISAMMQGISQNKLAVKYFIYGTIAKILAQVPMILIFGTFGPLISSAIGFLVANGLIIKSLDNQFGFRSYQMLEKLNFILIFSLVTYLVALATVYLGNTVVGIFTNSYSRVGSFIVVALAVIVGGFIYSYLSLKSRIADYVIGHQSDKLRKILHIK